MAIINLRSCSNCAHYSHDYKNAGLCDRVGVLKMRGEYIIDSIEMFNKLEISSLEYRSAIVTRKFACKFWKKR
jgi:hypothetical protein